MLRARAHAADKERNGQEPETGARAGQAVAGAGKRSSEREHRGRTQTFGDEPRGNLQAGHGAGEQRAQQPELGKAQPELPLPDRQHHINEVGIAVVQRVGAAADGGGAALVALERKPALAVHRRIEHRLARDTHLAVLMSQHSSRTTHVAALMASARPRPCARQTRC